MRLVENKARKTREFRTKAQVYRYWILTIQQEQHEKQLMQVEMHERLLLQLEQKVMNKADSRLK